MRIGLLSSLTLAITAFLSSQAQASFDDFCNPNWRVLNGSLDLCNNLPFLSPGNDNRVNLRLLLADKGTLRLTPKALDSQDLEEGYGPVPFGVYRLHPTEPEHTGEVPATAATLTALLEKLGVTQASDQIEIAGDTFLSGEGSRCRSNSYDSARDFLQQLVDSDLTPAERVALAYRRMQLLEVCNEDGTQDDIDLSGDIQSPLGRDFATYLQAAADFYSGQFNEASSGFAALKDSAQAWLKETALYMEARTALNAAQQNAFDEYDVLTREHMDKSHLLLAETGFDAYLSRYPQGLYAASAKGLMRRVHWLGGETGKLGEDFAWQLTQSQESQRNVSLDDLVEEVDIKLLSITGDMPQVPLLLAVNDLMRMRPYQQVTLARETLEQQKTAFAKQPALYDYLLAAFALYVEKNPDNALKGLPTDVPENPDYLAFSQQTLRGLALEAKHDWEGAQALWLQLLPLAKQPLQREQLELALAMNYERSQQLAMVFALNSPIKSSQVRYILLRKVADAALLQQQIAQASDPTERATAQFVLLYKDLLYKQYANFAQDFKQLPAPPIDDKLGVSLGYLFGEGRSLTLFQWRGDKAESGYTCPSIAETATALKTDAKSPSGLNCLGEFILRNGLDGMPLDQRPNADTLGGTPSGFKGELFSRLDGYQSVIANTKAAPNDRAYALYRAINCFAPSGNNSCGGADVAPTVRKDWFRLLKTTFADTQWGKSLQYYW
jgi:hypothetical protein